jgi:uncharacterized membrane protein YhaH (DUF805 family)
MGFREAIASVFRKYAEFDGRARRSEYWYFVLFNVLIYVVLIVASRLILLAGVSGGSVRSVNAAVGSFGLIYVLYGVYGLATIVPSLALCCRRLHDIGRPGPYMLFVLIPVVGWIFVLIWVLQEGDHGPNQYGPDPKQRATLNIPVREHHYSPRQYNGGGNDYDSATQSIQRVQAPAAAPAPGTTVYLEGIAGCFSGHRIPVRGTVVAGRNPGCGIRFPQDTHGVSHQHCQFRVNGSSLVVTDVGSSFGTFVNDRRLLPNQPVKLTGGDTVLLGSRKQGFRVL